MLKFERISVCNLVFFVLTWFGVYIDRCQEDLCLLWISSISLRLFFDKWISWISGCPDCRDSHVRRPTIPLGGWGQRGRYKHRDHDLYNLLVSPICTTFVKSGGFEQARVLLWSHHLWTWNLFLFESHWSPAGAWSRPKSNRWLLLLNIWYILILPKIWFQSLVWEVALGCSCV